MNKNQEDSVKAFKRIFPGEPEYIWNSTVNKDFLSFKIKDFSECSKDVLIYVEIIDYCYDNVNLKKVSYMRMSIFKEKMKRVLNFDLSVCSIEQYDIRIINQDKFIIPEKTKKSELKIYTGRIGFEDLETSSYLFNDDKDDLIKSYEMALMSSIRDK